MSPCHLCAQRLYVGSQREGLGAEGSVCVARERRRAVLGKPRWRQGQPDARRLVLPARCSLHRSLVKPHSERGLSPWKPKKGQHLISEPTSFRTGASCENPSPQAQGSLGKATLCGTVQRAGLPRGSEVRELGRALPVWESPFHTEVLAGPRCRHGGPAPAHRDCQAPGAHTIGKPAPLQPQRIRERLPQRRAIHTPPLTLSARRPGVWNSGSKYS